MKKLPLIIVAGPTASGKTRLAIEIAKSFDGEIVSADSMQIYKYMDIGTAKPTAEERSQAVHHLIDFVEPDKSYSVAEYVEDAHGCIVEIISRSKMPVMCGGTGLYIDSVANDITFGETEADNAMREELRSLAEKHGAEYLIKMLAEFDPVSAQRLHPNNIKRVIRAIEFYRMTGVPISEHQEETKKKESRYNAVMFCLDWERETLYDRINKRVDIMMSEGLLDEVKKLRDMGYTRDMQSMQGIGYKEMLEYLDGETTLDEAVEAVKQGSRRYAKRQVTWFKRNENIHWLKPENAVDKAIEIINKIYK